MIPVGSGETSNSWSASAPTSSNVICGRFLKLKHNASSYCIVVLAAENLWFSWYSWTHNNVWDLTGRASTSLLSTVWLAIITRKVYISGLHGTLDFNAEQQYKYKIHMTKIIYGMDFFFTIQCVASYSPQSHCSKTLHLYWTLDLFLHSFTVSAVRVLTVSCKMDECRPHHRSQWYLSAYHFQ